ncbi:hypothetical protein QQF64_002819 [Cirrhinus molitorella]|uniref:PiggyBac transposable element-derived protein domain-containing protein n=1 Tax=Cirrhinus molitorella TaxID=172907 RepID=A0ABR3MRA2_9TELE
MAANLPVMLAVDLVAGGAETPSAPKKRHHRQTALFKDTAPYTSPKVAKTLDVCDSANEKATPAAGCGREKNDNTETAGKNVVRQAWVAQGADSGEEGKPKCRARGCDIPPPPPIRKARPRVAQKRKGWTLKTYGGDKGVDGKRKVKLVEPLAEDELPGGEQPTESRVDEGARWSWWTDNERRREREVELEAVEKQIRQLLERQAELRAALESSRAARAHAKGHKYKWTDVSISELYCYIGLLFYMAMVKMRSIRDYWRQDSLFSVPFPATIMSRDRYRTISWNLHISHPDADKDNDRKRGTSEHERLFRVRPLMDTIRHACKAIYHPRKNLAVDERMVACKANTGMTQYMKAKPTRWGFKLFVLADSSNGYTVDFAVYTGKNNFPTGHGLSYDALTSLLDHTVLGSGYHVYMDNFYTSPKLLTDLFALKFGACGTYRDNRKDCPRNAANSPRNL